ncbi:Flagellum attachment zone protein 18 [Trypanosoma cruzi]|uniref:Flagellum attachment zone protein 18 n=1 Tax=Trypanosoma cruzi TaxID=5693 RepID=A0A7J6YHE9_TRYCR|nr:Flagellum attachment zone protein 18 [Trypanosoma cruzi]
MTLGGNGMNGVGANSMECLCVSVSVGFALFWLFVLFAVRQLLQAEYVEIPVWRCGWRAMSGAGSDFALVAQPRGTKPALVADEVLSPFLQPRLRLSSSGSDGVPSVVLVGPSPPTPFLLSQRGHLSMSVSSAEGDVKMPGNLPRDEESHFRLCESSGVLCAVETRTSRMGKGAIPAQKSPTCMSGCPRSPRTATGRDEEATEARGGPGYFSPTRVYKSNGAAAKSFNACTSKTRGVSQVTLKKKLDEASASQNGDRLLMENDLGSKLRRESSEILAGSPGLRHVRPFADCTNVNCVSNGGLKAPLMPAGINRSYHSQQEEKRPIQYRKGSSFFSSDGFKQTLQAQLSSLSCPCPSSVDVTEGERREAQKTSVPRNSRMCDATKKHWVLDDDEETHGEADEEPVLLSVLIDRGLGKMCEEEAEFWKHRCALAEEQMAVENRNVDHDDDEFRSCMTAQTLLQQRVASTPDGKGPSQLESLPHCLNDIRTQRVVPKGEIYSVSQQVEVGKKGDQKNEEEEEASKQIEGRRFVASTSQKMVYQDESPKKTAEKENQWVLKKECEQLQRSIARLRSEHEDLRRELETQVIRSEKLEMSLVAKEEQQAAEREEWLLQENKLKNRQEKLAAALRQVHRHVSSTAEKLEQSEKDLEASRKRCCALETELAAAKMEVLGLKATCTEHLEEGQRLQKQLEQLESELRPCDASMMNTSSIDGSDKTAIYKGDIGDGTALTDVSREDTERRIRAVLLAMRRGESRHEWIASELIDAAKALGGRDVNKTTFSNVDKELRQLMQSLDVLLKFNPESSYDVWDFPPVEDEQLDGQLTAINDGNSITDCVSRAQERVSQLVEWASALQRRHSELTEELEVVRADRNELVGRQNKGAQHLQKLLLSAEEEMTRLKAILGERNETIRKLKEEWRSAGDSSKEPARRASEGPFVATQATGDDVDTLHGARTCDFERLIEHMEQQTEIFGNSLDALLMETLEAVKKAHENHLTQAEWRNIASPERRRGVRKERDLNQRAQDESLDALRSELKSVRVELAEKESAIRTLLRLQMRQGEKLHQELRNEPVPKTPGSLGNSPASFCRVRASSTSLGGEKFADDISNGPVLDSPKAAPRSGGALCATEDGVLHFHSADRTGTVRGTLSSFVPATVSGHGKPNQPRHHRSRSQHMPRTQFCSLSPSGEIVSGSSSSSGRFSNLLPREATDEHHSCSNRVQRGVMRKHQEVWMRQAEMMGILTDVSQYGASSYRTTSLQTEN